MTAFGIVLSNKAGRGLDRADRKIQKRFFEAIEELKNNPVPAEKYDVTKLSGSESNYRIRISGYRVLYCVDWQKKEITIFDIDKRKDRTYH